MLETLSESFFKNGNSKDCFDMVEYCKNNSLLTIGIYLGKYFLSIFRDNIGLAIHTADMLYLNKNYEASYDLYSSLTRFLLNEESLELVLNGKAKCIKYIVDKYTSYSSYLFSPRNKSNLITFTITTCKRYDLFQKTINSFLTCCQDKDLIDRWICVDDNSSQEDREKMKVNYPFFEFYFKTPREKGHPQSMNIIRGLIDSPFIFHMEDDWTFFEKSNYISNCIQILQEDPKIGQCLVNKNYSETDQRISGGFLKVTKSLFRYYIHEYTETEDEKNNFKKKYGECLNCAYWPHYSLRPSLLRKSVLDILGEYNTSVPHFEMEYSHRYVKAGFVSAFLEGNYCYHSGRLTSERHDTSKLNAYILNNESQFGEKNQPIPNLKTFIINLDRRKDRYEKLDIQAICNLNPERASAIDGKKLSPNDMLQRIFEGNDYNMKSGMVGCALSHIKLFIDLVNSSNNAFLILEDDVQFHNNFYTYFKNIYFNLPHLWDIVFLGHIPRSGQDTFTNDPVKIEQWNTQKSLAESLGGTIGYIISKKGALGMLEFINANGMINCIDTMMQRFADFGNVYYCVPQIVRAPFEPEKGDVQTEYESLSLNRSGNLSLFPERLKIQGKFDITSAIQYKPIILE